MLREISGVRQDDPQRLRRWFQDDYLDCFVWVVDSSEIVAFQLSYDRMRSEHLFAWSREHGFSHHRVDSGESHPLAAKSTPLLAGSVTLPIAKILTEFETRSSTLDVMLRSFILDKLRRAARHLT